MKLLSPIDVTVLTWLKPELDSTLHQARSCLEQYVEDGKGVAVLRECGQHLHQVAGILNMVELSGAARLAEEMEQLSGRLAEDKAQVSENAFSLLMQCIVQLPDYLERLQNGHRDVPGVLLPLINELRSIGNHPPLHEESVYTASTQLPMPADALTDMRAHYNGAAFGDLALQFQAHLIAWLNGQVDRAAAGQLADTCEKIVAHCQDDSSRKLFWVASVLLHAVADGKLEVSKGLRQSIVKIDQEVSYINNRSTGDVRQESPVRMCQELLYFVSLAPNATDGLKRVYEAFDLAHNIPDEAEIKHAKSSLLGRNNALLQSVSAVIKEDILRVKDSLDMAIRQSDSKPVDMAELVEVLARIESTLGLIDANKAKELIRINREVVSGFAASGASPGESKLMEIAKSLLSVEMMLDHKVADIAGRKQVKMASDFLSSSQSNQLLDALIRESIVNFTLARQAYVAFVESYWDHEQLAAVPTLLKQISGALAILEFTPVSSYLDAINAFTRVEFIENHGKPNGMQMERLAEVLASLEYYLESVRDRRPNRERILEITERSLVSLNYWPIPEHALHTVTAPVAAYVPVETQKPAEPSAAEATPEVPAVQAVKPAEDSDWTIGVDESGDSLLGFDLGAEGIDDEIREIFLEEFAEESGNLHSFFDKWKSEPENFELIRPIRRVFHTLKGSGRLVGAIALSEFSWKIESLLNRVLDESRPASESVVSMIGIAIDALPKFQQALLGGTAYLDVEGLSDVAERLAGGEELVYQPKQAGAASPAAQDLPSETVARTPEATPIIDPVLLEILKPEVGGHLETVNRWLQHAAVADSPAFEDEVFRAIHTMNGAFAMTEVSSIAGVLAPAESLIRRSIAHKIGAKAEVIACLAQVADAVQATLDDLSSNVLPSAYPDLETWVAAKRDELPELPTSAIAPMALIDSEAERLETERLEAERLEAERLEAERVEAERVEAERVEAERLEAERVEAERVEAERLETERVEAERVEAERVEAERLEAERVEAERVEAERVEAERVEAERVEAERVEAERVEAERVEAERVEAERVEAERVEAERVEAERLEAERLEAERLEAERLEAERLEAERLEAERVEAERLETERLAAERLAAERTEAERLEAERVEAERLETERLAAERLAAERTEAERLEAQRLEAERLEAERLEAERLEAERLEAERLEAERLEAERLEAERVEAERLEAERLEAERLEAERLEAERLEAERVEAERVEAERVEAERVEAERVEAERVEAERVEAERVEAERVEAERVEAERVEAERVEAEQAAAEKAAVAALAATKPNVDTKVDVKRIGGKRGEAMRLEAKRLEAKRLEAERLEAIRIEAEKAENTETTGLAELTSISAVSDKQAPSHNLNVGHIDDVASELVSNEINKIEHSQAAVDGTKEQEEQMESLDMSDLDEELLDIFTEEAKDLLDQSDNLLVQLKESPDNFEFLFGLQRNLHTIKGGARMAGLFSIGELSHSLESLLQPNAEQGVVLSTHQFSMVEKSLDALHQMAHSVEERKAPVLSPELMAMLESGEAVGTPAAENQPVSSDVSETVAATLQSLKALSSPIESPDLDVEEGLRTPQEVVRIRADLLEQLVNFAGEVAIYRARLEQQLGLFKINLVELDQTTSRLREQLRRLDIETEAQIAARNIRETDRGNQDFDPLELDRFTNQQQLSRSLAESSNDLVNLQATMDDLTRHHETLLLQQSRVSSELQEGLMRTRMLPFESLLPRLRRVLRQASQDSGKQVQLKVEGAHGEMDRTVLDRMIAPLEHLLRNAVAHGIETGKERKKAGKPESGNVTINITHEGTEVVLSVRDDGRGLDVKQIRDKGVERGLIKAGAELSEQQILNLITQTGFTTADSITRLSGRGIGMDVVSNEIKNLNGNLSIQTTVKKGTEFIIRLPLNLAVTKAVFVKIGENLFAIPIASVDGVGRIGREELEEKMRLESPEFNYAGNRHKIYDLGNLLEMPTAKAAGSMQVPMLLSRSGQDRIAICVDQVLGSQEIVVKPVGPQVTSVPGVYGASIMPDGGVVVILDLAPLVRHNAARIIPQTVETVDVNARSMPLVMVVDDSITMRKVTSRILERNNYEVMVARDGLEAIEKMAEQVPDLVLLDIEMPRMDGYEVAQNMKADARLKDVPIMMITSRTGEKHRQRAFELGVERYLGKPYQEFELMRQVNEIFSK